MYEALSVVMFLLSHLSFEVMHEQFSFHVQVLSELYNYHCISSYTCIICCVCGSCRG